MPFSSKGRGAYKKAKTKYVKERNSPRGLVPAYDSGIVDEPYESYLSGLNPRGDGQTAEALQLALATSKDPRFRAFLDRLSEPIRRKSRLSTIAKSCDISLPEFAQFWSNAQQMRVVLHAQNAAVEVIADIAEDAKSGQMICERCDGFGTLFLSDADRARQKTADEIRVCPGCKGTGIVRKSGDTDARKMLLDIAGMTQKNKSPAISLTQNFGTIESSMDSMRSVTFDIGGTEIDSDSLSK